ncbi:uncharacterized protein B0H64DRAFT_377837 [Chaetomium fimeti]|uniref:AMP-dependent synthetase/ligase domain-containing protein n=1 Tax=Chaetomium fimeti TaxID=1854472 RepID=A0AAE0LNZ9_9PEZI|nr:hypothetical protein B0H64DRAFT_377837 [Chaetomium fimeti]
MSTTAISPTAAALKARTLQEFVSHTKHLTGGAFGFPRRHVADIEYLSPQQTWWTAHRAAQRYVIAGFPSTERTTVGLRNLSTINTVISFVAIVRLGFSVGVFGMLFALMKPGGSTCWANERLRLDADVYRDVLVATRPQLARCHPGDLIRCMATPEGLAVLKQCIMEGVHLSDEYSMSELAFALSSGVRQHGDSEWGYMAADVETAPHPQLYELVVLPSHPTQDKGRANSPDGSFYTGNVFVKHPTKERYKCIGRMSDDVLIVPQNDRVGLYSLTYEHRVLAGSRDVLQEAVLFGNERTRAGVLLFTQPGCAVSSEEVVERVWATVQRDINQVLPVGLDTDMLVVVRDAVVPWTAKGNFVRQEAYRKYEREINQAYGVD